MNMLAENTIKASLYVFGSSYNSNDSFNPTFWKITRVISMYLIVTRLINFL